MTGLCVVRNVEVEYLTGRGNVFPRNVHTLTLHTTSAMERIMKRRSVMKNAVKNQTTLVNGQIGVNVVPAVERAKNIARGYATNQSVQQITEDVKENTKSMLIVIVDVVQVSNMPAIPASK